MDLSKKYGRIKMGNNVWMESILSAAPQWKQLQTVRMRTRMHVTEMSSSWALHVWRRTAWSFSRSRLWTKWDGSWVKGPPTLPAGPTLSAHSPKKIPSWLPLFQDEQPRSCLTNGIYLWIWIHQHLFIFRFEAKFKLSSDTTPELTKV